LLEEDIVKVKSIGSAHAGTLATHGDGNHAILGA